MAMLFLKLDAFEARMEALGIPSEHTNDSAPIATFRLPKQQAPESVPFDATQLRRIVREELQAAGINGNGSDYGSDVESQSPVYDATEMALQRELVMQEMDMLKVQDLVTTAELDRLMGEIARLNPEARSEMLGELNRAMNRGEIKGNL